MQGKKMKEIWNAFEKWLEINWPEGLNDLNPPASEEEIENLERALNVSLPEDYKDCLRVHNGQAVDAAGIFDNSEFLSTNSVLEQWKVWKELLDSGEFDGINSDPQVGVKNSWWNARWIPFTHNGGGDHYCIDLEPALHGRCGQVITMWHDMAERPIQAKSFKEWFNGYVQDVLDGKYVYSDDFGGLIHIDYA